MKRGDIATYPEWLTTVEEACLRAWLKEDTKLVMQGNEFALIYAGPYPLKQEADEKDETVKRLKVRRTQRMQWYAEELERRENGGEIAPKVRL